jgi:hypothetical protein
MHAMHWRGRRKRVIEAPSIYRRIRLGIALPTSAQTASSARCVSRTNEPKRRQGGIDVASPYDWNSRGLEFLPERCAYPPFKPGRYDWFVRKGMECLPK